MISAHACAPPAETLVAIPSPAAAESRWRTPNDAKSGTYPLETTVPSPRCPSLFIPQHRASPIAVSAHENSQPNPALAMAPPGTETSDPSLLGPQTWPLTFPQLRAVPSGFVTRTCRFPTATPVAGPAHTTYGVSLEYTPSIMTSKSPQHDTDASATRTAQVCFPPAARADAPASTIEVTPFRPAPI